MALCDVVTSKSNMDFLTALFSCYGQVRVIVTDNGVHFVSSEFEDFLLAHGNKHTRTAL